MSFLESVFNLLALNQQLPYYQAERRIDIFINYFLNDIVSQHTKFKDAKYVAAEFPLKKNSGTDHAAHIDYLMVSEQEETVLFVELKTDNVSFDKKQIELYLLHDFFQDWKTKFDFIKMQGYKRKKETLRELIETKLQNSPDKYRVNVIVLKPFHKQQDYNGLENLSSRIDFISLKGLQIQTAYQFEWNLFRKEVLDLLPISDFDKIISIGHSGNCSFLDLHYFLPDFPTLHGNEYIFTNRWISLIKESPIVDIEYFVKGLHLIEVTYKKEEGNNFGFGSPSRSFQVVCELEKRDNAKASDLIQWIANNGGNYYIPAGLEPGASSNQPSLIFS